MNFELPSTATEAEQRAFRLGIASAWIKLIGPRLRWRPNDLADAKARLARYVETGEMCLEVQP